jgi:hypothetical protein
MNKKAIEAWCEEYGCTYEFNQPGILILVFPRPLEVNEIVGLAHLKTSLLPVTTRLMVYAAKAGDAS